MLICARRTDRHCVKAGDVVTITYTTRGDRVAGIFWESLSWEPFPILVVVNISML